MTKAEEFLKGMRAGKSTVNEDEDSLFDSVDDDPFTYGGNVPKRYVDPRLPPLSSSQYSKTLFDMDDVPLEEPREQLPSPDQQSLADESADQGNLRFSTRIKVGQNPPPPVTPRVDASRQKIDVPVEEEPKKKKLPVPSQRSLAEKYLVKAPPVPVAPPVDASRQEVDVPVEEGPKKDQTQREESKKKKLPVPSQRSLAEKYLVKAPPVPVAPHVDASQQSIYSSIEDFEDSLVSTDGSSSFESDSYDDDIAHFAEINVTSEPDEAAQGAVEVTYGGELPRLARIRNSIVRRPAPPRRSIIIDEDGDDSVTQPEDTSVHTGTSRRSIRSRLTQRFSGRSTKSNRSNRSRGLFAMFRRCQDTACGPSIEGEPRDGPKIGDTIEIKIQEPGPLKTNKPRTRFFTSWKKKRCTTRSEEEEYSDEPEEEFEEVSLFQEFTDLFLEPLYFWRCVGDAAGEGVGNMWCDAGFVDCAPLCESRGESRVGETTT